MDGGSKSVKWVTGKVTGGGVWSGPARPGATRNSEKKKMTICYVLFIYNMSSYVFLDLAKDSLFESVSVLFLFHPAGPRGITWGGLPGIPTQL